MANNTFIEDHQNLPWLDKTLACLMLMAGTMGVIGNITSFRLKVIFLGDKLS